MTRSAFGLSFLIVTIVAVSGFEPRPLEYVYCGAWGSPGGRGGEFLWLADIAVGPDVMFDADDVGVNVNLSPGGDFPLGHGWSVLLDGTVDVVLAYGQVGVAYWFQ